MKQRKELAIITLFKANKIYIKTLFTSCKLFIILQIVMLLIVSPINYWSAYAPKNFIDSIVEDHNLTIGLLWIALLIGIKYFQTISNKGFDILKRRALHRAKISSKEFLYNKLETLDLTFFESPDNLTNFNKALTYNENGGEFFFNLFVSTITSVIACATMTYISVKFEWWLWIIIVGLVIFQFFTDRAIKKINFKFSMERMARERKQNYYNGLPTNRDTLAEIKLNSTMHFFFNKYKKCAKENRNIQDKHDVRMNAIAILLSIPNEIFTFVCYWVIAVRLIDGLSTIGDYTLFFTMIGTINAQLKAIVSSISSYYEQSLSAKVYLDFVNNTSFFAKPNSPSIPLVNPSLDYIEFKNVSFCYPGKNKEAIKNISLRIKKGEKISIIGFNGAGKTTFIKLLTLLYPPTSGTIYISGEPADKVDSKEFWKKTGVVFQSHQEFAMSIRDNVLLKENTTPEDDLVVWESLQQVGIAEEIQKSNQGLDLQLTRSFDPNGRDFSGGERQKFAIARVLSKNCDLYIFDEPSSALDPLSEDLLYQSIQKLPQDKTVIFISHRLASIYISDRVLYFKDGRIFADGSHEKLMEECEEYKKLYETQSSKYK